MRAAWPQRSMGVDHIAGTSDLYLPPAANPHAGQRAAAGEPAAAAAAADPPREVAGGIATKFQWVRNGYVPPKPSPHEGPGAAEGAPPPHARAPAPPQQQQQQQQLPRYQPRPRPPSLLHKLLEKDIRSVLLSFRVPFGFLLLFWTVMIEMSGAVAPRTRCLLVAAGRAQGKQHSDDCVVLATWWWRRRDRSWLLQAIRFLVRNDFLQKGKAPPAAAAAAAAALAGPDAEAAGAPAASDAGGSGGAPAEPPAAGPPAEGAGGGTAAAWVVDEAAIDWPPEGPGEQALAALLPPAPADGDVEQLGEGEEGGEDVGVDEGLAHGHEAEEGDHAVEEQEGEEEEEEEAVVEMYGKEGGTVSEEDE